MHIEAILTVAASAASVVAALRIVMREAKRITVMRQKELALRQVLTEKDATLTVTHKGTNKSVELPAHYDRKAVSEFLELTA